MATPTIDPYGMGVRGNLTWATGERPQSYREGILYMFPNGMAPLTALLSRLPKEKVDDYQFHWFQKNLPEQGGAVTNVYDDAAMTTAYAADTDAAAGTTVYIKVAEAVAKEFRPLHLALLRDESEYTNDVHGKVTNVNINGANSQIAVQLLEADGGTGRASDLSDCDRIDVYGDLNPQGGTLPTPISYRPEKLTNYTQIFRQPFITTRTAAATRLRTGNSKLELKRESLELHSIQMEKSLIFGIPTENVGENAEPETTTAGLIYMINTFASGNIWDYTQETAARFASKSWDEAGELWLETRLEEIFRYGRQEKLAYCGSGALLGIQQLAKLYGTIQISVGQAAFGIAVVRWITPFGTLILKTHPLFSQKAVDRNRMIIFEPENLKTRNILDTTHLKDASEKKTNEVGFDGTTEEFMTEMGVEFHHPLSFGMLNGVGLDNSI